MFILTEIALGYLPDWASVRQKLKRVLKVSGGRISERAPPNGKLGVLTAIQHQSLSSPIIFIIIIIIVILTESCISYVC